MAIAALSSFRPRWIESRGEISGDSRSFAKSANDGAPTLIDMPPQQAFGPTFNFYEEMMS